MIQRRVRSCSLILALVCLPPGSLDGVGAEGPAPRSIAEAEAEGATYPKGANFAEAIAERAKAFATAAGSPDRKCVDVAKHATIRSGDFLAGPFHEYYVMAGTGKRKLWWSPRRHSADMPPLRLRASKVGAPDVTVDWTLSSVAWNEGGGTFFNTLIVFPENGQWMVVTTSADNWGCFLVTETQAKR